MGPRRAFAAPGRAADDRFLKTVALPWVDLRDRYFDSFRRVALPFLDMFPTGGGTPPAEWLTRERVEAEFAKFEVGVIRLFED